MQSGDLAFKLFEELQGGSIEVIVENFAKLLCYFVSCIMRSSLLFLLRFLCLIRNAILDLRNGGLFESKSLWWCLEIVIEESYHILAAECGR